MQRAKKRNKKSVKKPSKPFLKKLGKEMAVKAGVETEIIDRPYVHWKGKWRRGMLAVIIKNHHQGDQAWVRVTAGQIVRMHPKDVHADGESVAKLQKKYAHGGWVVDDGVVHKVYLTFETRYNNSEGSFVFRTEESRKLGPGSSWHRDCWDIRVLEENKKWKRNHRPQFFTKETAALRYAIRMKRRGLKPEKDKIVKEIKELEELEARHVALKQAEKGVT